MPVRYQAEWVAFAAAAGSMITLDPHTDDAAANPDAYTHLVPRCTAFLPSALESERLSGPTTSKPPGTTSRPVHGSPP